MSGRLWGPDISVDRFGAAVRPEMAGCRLSPRSPVRPLSCALRAFHTRVAVRSGLNGRHGVSKLRNTG